MNHSHWQTFVRLCNQFASNSAFEDFLKFILTPEECEQITTRLLIIQELLKGEKTQREIAQTCQVSIAKITRGSNELKKMDPLLKSQLKKFLS